VGCFLHREAAEAASLLLVEDLLRAHRVDANVAIDQLGDVHIDGHTVSMYASSRERCFSVTRKSTMLCTAISAAVLRSGLKPMLM